MGELNEIQEMIEQAENLTRHLERVIQKRAAATGWTEWRLRGLKRQIEDLRREFSRLAEKAQVDHLRREVADRLERARNVKPGDLIKMATVISGSVAPHFVNTLRQIG